MSLVSLEELDLLNDIEAVLRRQIRDEVVPGFELDPRARAEADRPVRSRANAGRSGGYGRGAGSSGRDGGSSRDGGYGRSTGPRRNGARSGATARSPRTSAPQAHRSGPAQPRPSPNGGTFSSMPGETFSRNRAEA